MLSGPRERAILERLEETGTARVEDLAGALGVTGETIRRALKRLEAAGRIARVHGGAHLKDWGPEPTFAQRMQVNPGAKRRIAEAVARMLPDGASVFLDVGSTTAYVAQALRARRELLVVTNSLPVAQALAGVNGNRVFMAGGELRAHDGGAFGAEALDFLRQFRVGHAILSVAAVNAEGGFLLQDLREAEFSRAMIARAETVIVAADAAKFGHSAPIAVAPPQAFHHLVTEAAPTDSLAAMLAAAGVRVTVAA
ncbi:DeoR/GlpR family DNA-binding transcription regulator [Rhodobacter sp. Har01]|uniref:DeoR/GlpR family DNA-binding transcription regulator n=1 Tax=Rhodobacter sp. Har01 TaxID=2883999 RepID=UPI001D089F68|nr:DeoR/GlpR family DNA-binding transcription regulator [Rhodobacter sp. Har01]MCB6177700.1 DeoR/GlpR family DNA-binding transcription regulator [Rhodobacter sp. Har01]